jgi:hypothetical protein
MAPKERPKLLSSDDLSFLEIHYKLGDHIVAGDIAEDLSIPEDPDSLATEILRYPSLYFYYSSMAEEAKRIEAVTRRKFDLWQAEEQIKLRRQLVSEGAKVTEAVLQAEFLIRYADELETWNDDIDRTAYKRTMLSLAAKSVLEKGTAAVNVLSYKKEQLKDSGRQQ